MKKVLSLVGMFSIAAAAAFSAGCMDGAVKDDPAVKSLDARTASLECLVNNLAVRLNVPTQSLGCQLTPGPAAQTQGPVGPLTQQPQPAKPGYPQSQPGYPAPQPYPAPAQPGYAAPTQPGYAAPTQPGYAAPTQPGYAAPAQPGYAAPAPQPYQAR